MIRLTCTNCKATLEMDDAFAGGVCRCQHCGTIQTVPSHLKGSAADSAVAQPAGTAGAGKSLYHKAGTAAGSDPGAGLDDLAGAVASSGLSRSGLQRGGRAPARGAAATAGHGGAEGQPAKDKKKPLVMILTGAGLFVVVAVVAFFLMRGGSSKPTPGTGGTGTPTPGGEENLPAMSGAHFVRQPISASRVVYVIDRGNSNKEVFNPLKAALFNSLDSLGPDREFQVLFWNGPQNTDFTDLAYPTSGVAKATKDQVDACKKKFEDLDTTGSTEVDAAVTQAMARAPGEILLATAKGINLGDEVVQAVEKARAGKTVKIHTFDLTSTGGGKEFLSAIAQKSGGTYANVAPRELR